MNFSDSVQDLYTTVTFKQGSARVCILDANGFGRDAKAYYSDDKTEFEIGGVSQPIRCANNNTIGNCLGKIRFSPPTCSGMSE